MGRKHKTRSLLSPFTIVVMTVFISAFVARYYIDSEHEISFGKSQKKSPTTQKIKNTKKQIDADKENPDVLIEAFAEIKRGFDGTTYLPGYRSEQLKEARSRLSLLKNSPRVDIDWKERGPGNISGRSRDVLVDPLDPSGNTWFVATVGGGVWKTTDAGGTWENKTPDLATLSTMTIAMPASDPQIIYVGTGMGYGRTIDLAGSGVWKSIDHGETWAQMASTAHGELLPAINRIVVDPQNPDLLLVCSNGDYTSHGPNGGSRESAIFRSTDGGLSWTKVFDPDTAFTNGTDNRIQQIIANPLNFRTLYASVNEVGVIKSTDAGLTWKTMADNFARPQDIGVGEGTYQGISTRTELAIAPSDTSRIYAAVERRFGVAELLMSKDGGLSWVEVVDLGNDPNWFNSRGQSGATGAYTAGWFDNTIIVSPYDKNDLTVGGVRIYKIRVNDQANTRVTSVLASQPHVDHHFLVTIPQDQPINIYTVLCANDGGLAISHDNGNNWRQITGLGTTQFYGVDKKPGENAYIGGMQDNGTSQSPADPDALTFWQHDVGGDGVEVLWNHGDPNLLLAGSQGGNLSRSTDGGNSWFSIPDAKAGLYAPFISKIAGSKQDADLVFTVGSDGVKRSDNFGQSWTLTPVYGNWMGWRTFDNVEISIADPQVVWISSRLKYEEYIGAQGGIHLSRDGGLSFTEVSENFPAGMTESSGIGTDPIDPATAFMLFSAAGGPKILKTTDYGQTWNDISAFSNKESSNGFPDVATYALIVMPYDPNILWAGTEIGLFISEDGGQNWFLAENGLPQVSIFQMAIVDGQIILATHGLGIWTVDIPELAGYQPPVATLSPRFKDIAFQPVGNVRLNFSLHSPYDSTLISLNDQPWIKLGPNAIRKDSTLYFPVTENTTLTFDITSYKEGREFSSAAQSVDVYITSVQSSYSSDFNSTGAGGMFAGDGFSVQSYTGFENNAIHSEHPYPVNKEYTYLLLIPIEVGSENTTLTYEDVALIEEGMVSDYTDPNFWDYVIVEGSMDGSNWLPLADGYDSQYDPDWSAAYQSGIVSGGDSNTPGNSSLYVTHTIDLLDTFNAGDVIFIRFRLSSDPAVVAWGWAIDNLNIQQTTVIEIPEQFTLAQNYPNPFNLSTTIEYDLPLESNVKISVFNILGQKVITLVDGFQTAGAAKTVTWNGLDKNNTGVASGTYLYRIEAGSFSQTKKMVLLK